MNRRQVGCSWFASYGVRGAGSKRLYRVILMKKLILVFAACIFAFGCSSVQALQRDGLGPTARDIDASPQKVGEAGVAWYTTWETGLAEAKHSNRPIFFMSAATTCSGIPGVF